MLPENFEKMEYKDLMKAHELRDGDSVMDVGSDTVLMYSLYADYVEFPKAQTVERIDHYQKAKKDGPVESTCHASTGMQYVELDDGSEWYVEIFGTRWDKGWGLDIKKIQAPFKNTTKGENKMNNVSCDIKENCRAFSSGSLIVGELHMDSEPYFCGKLFDEGIVNTISLSNAKELLKSIEAEAATEECRRAATTKSGRINEHERVLFARRKALKKLTDAMMKFAEGENK